jgi:alcohol dehydrogenase class IV
MKNLSDEARQKLEEILAPYGYYFSRRDRETELHLTFSDVGAFAVGMLLWGVIEYSKSFIQEKAKSDAQNLLGVSQPKIELVQQKLDEVLLELREVKAKAEFRKPLEEYKISEEALEQYLQECGLSKRAARQLTPNLEFVLNQQIKLLISGDE